MASKLKNSIVSTTILILLFIGIVQILASFGLLPKELNLLSSSSFNENQSMSKKGAGKKSLQVDQFLERHPVTEDFLILISNQHLPAELYSLREIQWNYYDPELEKLIPKSSIPFKTSDSGDFKLIIDAFSAPQKKSRISILQLNIVEIKSGNKIWELSRSYEFQDTRNRHKSH